jgi:predicted nucleotide-binding protein (sugar kinase/HSP70/actin superfamily)
MTLEEFMTGKSRELAYENRRTQARHNEFVDTERRKSVEFKRMTGTITDKQAEQALKDIDAQAAVRDKLQDLAEKLRKPMSDTERNDTLREFNKLQKENKKYQDKLEKRGVVIIDEKEAGETLRYGYYH